MPKRQITVYIAGDASGFSKSVDLADKKAGGFSTIGKKITAGLVVGGAALIAFGKKSADTFSRIGGEVKKLSRFTGATVQDASRLRFAAQQTGTDLDTMTRSLSALSKNLVTGKLDTAAASLKAHTKATKTNAKANEELLQAQRRLEDVRVSLATKTKLTATEERRLALAIQDVAAARKGGDAEGLAKAERRLGDVRAALATSTKLTASDERRLQLAIQDVSTAQKEQNATTEVSLPKIAGLGFAVKDAAGKLLPLNKVLLNVAAKFEKMPDGAEKTALAMQIFGKSGAAMIPFLNRGAKGIAELEKQSDKLGLTLNTKQIAAVAEATKQQRLMDASLEALQVQVGSATLPIMSKLTSAFSGAVQWVTQLSPATKTAVGGIVLLAGAGAHLTSTVEAAKAAQEAWTAVQKIATLVQQGFNLAMNANPAILITAAIVALGVAVFVAYKKVGWFRDAVDAVARFFTGTLIPVTGMAVGFVTDKFNGLMSFVGSLPGRLLNLGKGILNAITWPWRTGYNWIIGLLNDFEIKFKGWKVAGQTVVPGFEFDPFNIPKIPEFAKGGIVTRPTVGLLGERGPEAVVPLGRGGGMGTTINVNVSTTPGNEAAAGRAVVSALTAFFQSGGSANPTIRRALA